MGTAPKTSHVREARTSDIRFRGLGPYSRPVEASLRYRDSYPDEIAERIALHPSKTAAAETH